MKNRLLFLLLSFAFLFSLTTHAQTKDADGDDDDDAIGPRPPAMMKPTEKPAAASFACPYEKDFQQMHKIGGYTLRILPVKVDKDDKDDKDGDGDPRCRAVLSAPHGRKINIVTDWALAIDPISGADVNGDGKPEIVLNGYSGGLRCCYTSYIISLDRHPQLLHAFHNSVPVTYEKQADGSTLIRAADGVFDFFIVPHAQAVVPPVFLEMKGDRLVDVSSRFPDLYDKQIEQARSELTPSDLAKFRQANYNTKLFTDEFPTVQRVLTIVLDYVYSGREERAWQTLDDLWPPTDAGRVKSLILERRNRGLLANLKCDCRPALVAKQGERAKRKPSPADETTDPRIKAIIDD
ncbi:MAG TPA: hypothetical protein VI386_31535 [Candidatus Sulfotelmatobacter sp.]